MKVLYVAPQLGKGGAEDVLVNLVSFVAKENDVTLFLFNRTVEDSYNVSRLNENVKVVSFLSGSKLFQSVKSKIYNKLLYVLAPLIAVWIFYKHKFYQYDIVHINMTLSSFYAPFFKLLSIIHPGRQSKYVETFHTNWHLLKPFNKIVFPVSWSIVDHVVYEIGDNEINNIKNKSFAKSVSFIPFGCAEAEEPDQGFLGQFTDQYLNFDLNKTFCLMTIARLRLFEKKFDITLKVMKILREKGLENFKYIICGDGEDRKQIEMMVSDMDLTDNVILTGYVDKPQQLAYLCNVFMVAMVENTTGIAGLQAGMAGIPVIGIQTVKDYDGTSEFIYSSLSPERIADKILDLQDEKLYEVYRSEATDYIKTKFNLDKFFESYIKLYKGLLKSKDGS